MKVLLIGMMVLALAGCGGATRYAYDIIEGNLVKVPLTEAEVTAGLKDALSRGISQAALTVSKRDGYYADPRLRIEYPPEMKTLDKTLRKLGFGGEVDRFVKQLNRAAEKASIRAKRVFIKTITRLTIDDAFEILNGKQDAATRYLLDSTGEDLRELYLPIVSDMLEETSATRYYGEIVSRYNNLPFVFKVDADLEGYTTDKAIEGLFLLIAEEEANIRANSRARTTKLLRRVFDSLD